MPRRAADGRVLRVPRSAAEVRARRMPSTVPGSAAAPEATRGSSATAVAHARHAPAFRPTPTTPDPAVAAAPSSRSSPRAVAMATGPAGVFFRARSYAQTVAARGTATVRAGRPAQAARERPAPVRAQAAPRAAAGRIRPEGRAVRAFHGVHVTVGPVVEGHAGLVETEGGGDREESPGSGACGDCRRSGEGIAGDGEQGGQAQEFGPGPGVGAAGAAGVRTARWCDEW